MSIADFETIQKLGEGAYSTVFKVRRISDKKLYALKQVNFGPLKEKEKENALTEVRILASVIHANVVAYKEAFIDQSTNTLCIVMEFADYGDLFQKINKHKKHRTVFKEGEIWSLLIQATRGLKALHDLGIMHRDLKSANIFLNMDRSVKIGDMNVSKVARNGLVYTQTGTPYYASPEVWKDQPYNSKSDIWSLGCVIYEAITLSPPFKAKDMAGLYKKVIKGDYPRIPRGYSRELSDVVNALLRVNPHQRPSCDQILKIPRVMNHSQKNANMNPIDNSLLSTIYVPANFMSLAGQLPAPMYNRETYSSIPGSTRRINIEERNSQMKTKKKTSEKRFRVPSPEISKNDPLRPYYGEKKRTRGRGVPASPFIKDTVASRIKAVEKQLMRPKVVRSRVHTYAKPVVKPLWWE